MEFDEKLINSIREKYIDEIAINKALNEVENVIKKYFKSLEQKLKEEISVSNGKVKFDYDTENNEIVKLTINDYSLSFVKKDKEIEVIVSDYSVNPVNTIKAKKSIQHSHEYEYLANGDYIVNDGLLNSYLKKAFENIV